jgi:membrane protein
METTPKNLGLDLEKEIQQQDGTEWVFSAASQPCVALVPRTLRKQYLPDGELQATLNLIWEVRPAPTNGVWAGIWALLRDRLFSLALVLALAFLLLVSLVISAALAGAAALFQGPEQALVSRLLELAVSLLVLTFVFALLYMYVPDAEIGWRDVWLGGLITAVLFTLGKTAIGFYLGQASVGSAYGAAGSLVVLLVWVYYSALIMFFGAEFTHAWATRQGEVTPQPHAIPGAAPQTKSEAATDRPPSS